MPKKERTKKHSIKSKETQYKVKHNGGSNNIQYSVYHPAKPLIPLSPLRTWRKRNGTPAQTTQELYSTVHLCGTNTHKPTLSYLKRELSSGDLKRYKTHSKLSSLHAIHLTTLVLQSLLFLCCLLRKFKNSTNIFH